MEYILKAVTGDYLGEGDTFNSDREYAKRFPTVESAEDVAASMRWAALKVEPYRFPGHGFGGSLESVG